MDNAIATIAQDYLRYKKLIQAIEAELAQLPTGNLTYRNVGGHRYCHLQFPDAQGKYHNNRIPAAEIDKMQQLLDRRDTLKETTKQFQRYIKILEKGFPQLLSLATAPDATEQNLSVKSVEKCYLTHKGDYVRSKSEVMIANELYTNQILYDYEKPLTLEGYSNPFYPDFTIYTPKEKQVVYWEHCGLMSNSSYREKWERKKRIYERAGISEWKKNLIITYEYQAGDFGLDDILQHIERLLQR